MRNPDNSTNFKTYKFILNDYDENNNLLCYMEHNNNKKNIHHRVVEGYYNFDKELFILSWKNDKASRKELKVLKYFLKIYEWE